MIEARPEIRWWLWGLLAFAVVIAMSLAITAPEAVTWGIGEHQAAGTAWRVDEIQTQWREGGVRGVAIAAMLGDLVFIGIYGWGSWLAGRSFLAMTGLVRVLGLIVAIAAIVFVLCDYTETVLQLIQLVRDRGSDAMAGIAATVRPLKVMAWLATFFGIIAALLIRTFAGRPT